MSMFRIVAGVAVVAAMGAGVASADIVYFSGALSDDDDPDLAHFQASVEWDYSALDQLLTVTINNLTTTPFGYTLAVLSFNTSDAVTGLSLVTNLDYPTAALDANPPAQGGFGSFDWRLDLGSGNDGLLLGQSTTFSMNVTGDFLSNADFFGGAGSAVIHFARGPQPTGDEDSVWGLATGNTPPPPITVTVVPEPASLALLGIGLVGMGMRRRFWR